MDIFFPRLFHALSFSSPVPGAADRHDCYILGPKGGSTGESFGGRSLLHGPDLFNLFCILYFWNIAHTIFFYCKLSPSLVNSRSVPVWGQTITVMIFSRYKMTFYFYRYFPYYNVFFATFDCVHYCNKFFYWKKYFKRGQIIFRISRWFSFFDKSDSFLN